MKKIIKRIILFVLVIILTVGILMGVTGYSDYKQVLEEESLSQKTEKIRSGVLSLEPCIPSTWKEYLIRYKYGKSIYNIKVSNSNGKCTGIEKFSVNGNEISEKCIKLDENGGIFEVEVVM